MLDEVVEAPGLLAIGDGVGLEGMDHVGKLDGVANEEHLQVVAHQIPVAVLGIELDREAPRIARGLGRLLGPMTVENLRKTGVFTPVLVSTLAQV